MTPDQMIAAIVKPLGPWSDPAPPNEQVPYDHCQTEGDPSYRIEWKSWKLYDSYAVYLIQHGTEVYVTSEPTLAAAQAAAEADYRARIAALLDLGKVVALVADVQYIASATDMEGYEPGMWAINRARGAIAAFKGAQP